MNARSVTQFTARLFAAAFIALFVTACEHAPSAPGQLASITVVSNPDSVIVLGDRQFVAIGKDANGTVVEVSPTWSVAAGGGTIAANGRFTAGSVPGTYVNSITATSGGLSGTATVKVLAGAPASVVVTPTPVTLALGATQQFTAVFKDAGGNIVPTAVPFWSVTAGGGTINSATGLFTAGTASGTFTNTVVASIGNLAGSATVIVTPNALASITVTPNPQVLAVGATQQFTAVGKDNNGNVVAFTPSWSVQAAGGTINATGLFTAGTVSGTFINTIRACTTTACAAGSMSGFATVTVGAGVLANISVTPNPIDVGTNARQQFTAIGTDANGNVITILPVWSMKTGAAFAGGTVLQGGGYNAPSSVGTGLDSIVATLGSISGAARINVKASSALVSISVTPNPANVVVNGTQTFTATGFDGAGLIVPTPGLSWSVVAGGGSINSTSGLFTAGTVVGTYANTVKATSGTIFGYATVNVTAAVIPPVASYLGSTISLAGIFGSLGVTCGSGAINADVMTFPGVTWTQGACTFTGATHLGDGVASTARGELNTALVTLMTLPCDVTYSAGADLGTISAVLPLAPGVHCSATTFLPTGIVRLAGPASGVWIFQAGSSLTAAVGSSVLISGGGLAKNVYWANGASATLNNAAAWQGNILASSSVTLGNGVTLLGRALAHTGTVSMGTLSTITLP